MKTGRSVARTGRSALGVLVALLAIAGPTAAQTVRIGAPLALTGGLADEGRKQQVAYDLWAKRVNAAGGMTVGAK